MRGVPGHTSFVIFSNRPNTLLLSGGSGKLFSTGSGVGNIAEAIDATEADYRSRENFDQLPPDLSQAAPAIDENGNRRECKRDRREDCAKHLVGRNLLWNQVSSLPK